MLIFEHFPTFIKIFNFIGHAPISSIKLDMNCFTQLLSLVLSSSTATFIAIFLLFFPHISASGTIHGVIGSSSVLSGLFVVLSANWECSQRKNIYKQLIHRLQQVEKLFIVKFSLKETELVPKLYRKKVLLIFGLFFVSQSLLFSEIWYLIGTDHLLSSFFTSLLRVIHPLAVIHVMLYSDVITVSIQCLNYLTQNSPVCLYSKAQIEFLKAIKLVHLDIWKVVRQINLYFGWNLLFLTIHSFFYIQVQLYSVFLTLQVKFSTLEIVGKLSRVSIIPT